MRLGFRVRVRVWGYYVGGYCPRGYYPKKDIVQLISTKEILSKWDILKGCGLGLGLGFRVLVMVSVMGYYVGGYYPGGILSGGY